MSAPTDQSCHCLDFEAEDPEDTLSFVCVCGHVEEEHGNGFFRRCEFNTDKDEE